MRYYLNIVTGKGLIQDPDGEEFPHIWAALLEAEQVGRALMAIELEAGRTLPASWGIEIADACGVVLDEVSFGEILGLTSRPLPAQIAAGVTELLQKSRAAVIEARGIKLEILDGAARVRVELRNLSRLVGAIGTT